MTLRTPCANINPSDRQVISGTSSAPPHVSLSSCYLLLPGIPIKTGHIMSNFNHNLMGIIKLCDHNCCVLFEEKKCRCIFPGQRFHPPWLAKIHRCQSLALFSLSPSPSLHSNRMKIFPLGSQCLLPPHLQITCLLTPCCLQLPRKVQLACCHPTW